MKEKNLIIFLLEEEKTQPPFCLKTQINFNSTAVCMATKYENQGRGAQCNFGSTLWKTMLAGTQKAHLKLGHGPKAPATKLSPPLGG